MKYDIDEINLLSNIFGIHRIVDSKNKKIITFDGDASPVCNNSCFEFWNLSSSCENCISMRALNENKSFSKLEVVNDKLYFVIASPVNINDNIYIIEWIKDITDDDFYNYLSMDIKSNMSTEILRLNKLLVTDALTNTFNRRYLNEKLPYLISKYLEKRITFAAIMLDLDKFKLINDTYGHDCGDYVLKEVSKVILNITQENNGWVVRYGGDEFIIVFENISQIEGHNLSNTIKQIIDDTNLEFGEHKLNVTCSIGFFFPNSDNLDIDYVLKNVDIDLYNSKKINNLTISQSKLKTRL